ncbi:MAG: hypothetical protein ACYCVB_09460 [Bacilli bacterium]
MKSKGRFRVVSVALVAGAAIVLSGCGGSSFASRGGTTAQVAMLRTGSTETAQFSTNPVRNNQNSKTSALMTKVILSHFNAPEIRKMHIEAPSYYPSAYIAVPHSWMFTPVPFRGPDSAHPYGYSIVLTNVVRQSSGSLWYLDFGSQYFGTMAQRAFVEGGYGPNGIVGRWKDVSYDRQHYLYMPHMDTALYREHNWTIMISAIGVTGVPLFLTLKKVQQIVASTVPNNLLDKEGSIAIDVGRREKHGQYAPYAKSNWREPQFVYNVSVHWVNKGNVLTIQTDKGVSRPLRTAIRMAESMRPLS